MILPFESVTVYEYTPALFDKSVTYPTTPGIYSACVSTKDLCFLVSCFTSSEVI